MSATPTTDAGRAPAAPRRRRSFQPRAIATIALAWVLMWDRLSWGNVVNGILVGLFVTYAFPLPSIEFSGRLRPHRVAWLIVRFLGDLVAATWQVSRLAVGTRRPRNAVVEVQLRSRSDFYLTLVAELIALVPGSVVIDARRSTSVLYLHLLDVGRDGAIEAQRRHVLVVEERVVRALGSREEIAAIEAAKLTDPEGTNRPANRPADRPPHRPPDPPTGGPT
jgi:multicomponent Na+:H+ antiporter subunit E